MRTAFFLSVAGGLLVTLLLAFGPQWSFFLYAAVGIALLGLLGVHDVMQKKRAVLRNFPVVGHFRYLLELVRPEVNQYFIESNTDGTPFNREQRSVVYQRAKGELDALPFGTQLDVYRVGYEWIAHSLRARSAPEDAPRVVIGAGTCARPYAAALLNVSAMSFGSLSKNAVLALNQGAREGGFYHNTGEGSISPYHAARELPAGGRRGQGEDDRDQAVPGGEARSRRHPPGGQADRGDRAHPRRPHGPRRDLAAGPQRFPHSARAGRLRVRAARAVGRQARGRHRRRADRVLELGRHAARRRPGVRAQLPRGLLPARARQDRCQRQDRHRLRHGDQDRAGRGPVLGARDDDGAGLHPSTTSRARARRVRSFQAETVASFLDLLGAAGLEHPGQLGPQHILRRVESWRVLSYAEIYPFLETGALLTDPVPGEYETAWLAASGAAF